MTSPEPRPGLRERKKARTRAAIQEQALRLFREQGYDATTVEQIADAAEISRATFFRYFRAKEDVVLHDRYDPLLLAAFRAQPPEAAPLPALRAAVREVFGRLGDAELAEERQRGELVATVPELQRRVLAQTVATGRLLAEAVAERLGLPADDLGVLTLTGAVLGAGVAVVTTARPGDDYLELVDAALARLEQAL